AALRIFARSRASPASRSRIFSYLRWKEDFVSQVRRNEPRGIGGCLAWRLPGGSTVTAAGAAVAMKASPSARASIAEKRDMPIQNESERLRIAGTVVRFRRQSRAQPDGKAPPAAIGTAGGA